MNRRETMKLYPYQKVLLEQVRKMAKGDLKHTVILHPHQRGKTVLFKLIREAKEKQDG